MFDLDLAEAFRRGEQRWRERLLDEQLHGRTWAHARALEAEAPPWLRLRALGARALRLLPGLAPARSHARGGGRSRRLEPARS